MSDTATQAPAADEKKEEPKELVEGGRTFNEKVSVKQWDKQGKKFLNPVHDLWACRRDTKDGLMFDLKTRAGNSFPFKGSVIIDKEGNEFTVMDDMSAPFALIVKLTKKAEPKKP